MLRNTRLCYEEHGYSHIHGPYDDDRLKEDPYQSLTQRTHYPVQFA